MIDDSFSLIIWGNRQRLKNLCWEKDFVIGYNNNNGLYNLSLLIEKTQQSLYTYTLKAYILLLLFNMDVIQCGMILKLKTFHKYVPIHVRKNT